MPLPAKPKRIVFDLSLILQAVALIALIAALADLRVASSGANARTILVVVDNGPQARARDAHGQPSFDAIRTASAQLLDSLNANDQVFVARSSPTLAIFNAAPIHASEARVHMDSITPALSGPDAASIWLFAADRSRALAHGAPANIAIVSLQSQPPEAPAESGSWISISSGPKLANVAIVEAGSAWVESKPNAGPRILVRLANFSDTKADGRVVLESIDATAAKTLEEQPVSLAPQEQRAIGFSLAPSVTSNLRISWRSSNNGSDALPEDDSVVLAARPVRAPRIRFHAPHAALEALFQLSLNADLVQADETSAATWGVDLDVYVGSVPERLPAGAHAALLIAPERGYQSHFDVGDTLIARPVVQRGEDSPLNAGIAAGGNASMAVAKAFEILRTGDFLTLLRDASGHALAVRFVDEHARPFYVLAFSPGEGLPAKRALDPALAAMLVRITLEASQSGPPFVRTTAADLERASNQPLPLDWRPALAGVPPTGSGVLDEGVSNVNANQSVTPASETIRLSVQSATSPQNSALDLTPWLCALALLLAAAEIFVSRDA